MMQTQETEPPSRLRPPHFLIGRDRRGNWVVAEAGGMCGGLFVSRDAALRFVRLENVNRSQAVVMISETIELDMSRRAGAPAPQDTAADPSFVREVA